MEGLPQEAEEDSVKRISQALSWLFTQVVFAVVFLVTVCKKIGGKKK